MDPVKPVVEPTDKEKEKVDKEKEKEKGEVLAKIGDILKEYDNKESNIPLNHEYWGLVNRFRAN